MKTVIVGAGATGGFFGGLLARAGEDVTFLARGRTLEALRRHGMRIESVDFGDFAVVNPKATDDPSTIGGADLILVCVKSYDLDSALPSIHSLVGPDTIVMPILNGVDAHDRLAGVLGKERVLPGSARIESTVLEPGRVRHTSSGVHSITFGEYDGTVTERVAHVAETLQRGGFKVVTTSAILDEIWRKFVFMCGFSGVCAATRLPNGPILSSPPTRELVVDAMREVIAVARARGFSFGDEVITQQMGFLENRAPSFASSMLRDVLAGRAIEIEALNGAVVRFGREQKVPVPTNRFLYGCLKPYERGVPAAARG